MEKLSKLELADPALSKKAIKISEVDLILGAEYVGKILNEKLMEVSGLFLRSTKFGWTVSGPLVANEAVKSKFAGLTLKAIENDLVNFHKVEREGTIQTENKLETEKCREHFQSTYRIVEDGKFSVRLPFKVNRSKVAKNRRLALISLFRMEQKLEPSLKIEYTKFMHEYFALGHASPADPTDENCYFIPHRAVVREESLTTPVRVVFNASSHEKGQLSLNEALMIGPTIQRELFDILISVRTYCFVFSADVEKMYRMVWVDRADRDMQRILWRDSPKDPIKEYRLNTITYGTGPASFLATQCLEVIAQEIEREQPIAAKMIRENFYMDDLIAGGDDLQKVKSKLMIVHNSLAARGFKLRKYSANSQGLLSDLPEEAVLNRSKIELVSNVAMLGIVWTPIEDGFRVKLNLRLESLPKKITKRVMMSLLARTFDPLGLIAPVCLRGKLMIQGLWRAGMDWDISVPSEIEREFLDYLNDLVRLEKFVISRYVSRLSSVVQLIGFCDASIRAYCAVVFVRTLEAGVVTSCRMICAKTRVAPTKELTIPKMELNAALLLAQLITRVRRNLGVSISNCFLFTDATIVLCWLSLSPSEWKSFVSNRVEKIHQLVPYDRWFYVNTSHNPADLATCGLPVIEFLESSLWFHGPSFLSSCTISSNPIPNLDVSEALERRKKKRLVFQVVERECFYDRFSSFSKILRVLSYVARFCDRTRGVKINCELLPNATELKNALKIVIRILQSSHFSEEIARLSNDCALKATSKLLSLSPFLDEDGLLRVGGHLGNAEMSSAKKHPIILQAKDHLVKVMLVSIHDRYFHAGRKFVVNFVAARYWLVGGSNNAVKAVIRNCVTCVRYKGQTASQLMGQLPAFRVNVSRPFTHAGVDLAGPFQCRCVSYRTTRFYKIYMAIFVCMTVKAVHIEIVSDLSTVKFVEALQRFIARRGAPKVIYSDNGTNFVGIRNLIVYNQSAISSFVASEGIQWSMIPPHSPHFGGVWESAVRSAKFHLNRVLNGGVLSYDEYLTIFTRIEGILNSRPLCTSSEQGEEVITPGHFLVGQSLLSAPDLDSDCSSLPLSKRLREIDTRLKSFWKIWRSDYLNQLQKKYKWQRSQPNVRIGQLVLVKDESPPYRWPLAKVTEVHPDSSGAVRVVDLKLSNSSNIFKRSIARIVILPADAPPEPLAGSEAGAC